MEDSSSKKLRTMGQPIKACEVLMCREVDMRNRL
jgi:hypothetical protein